MKEYIKLPKVDELSDSRSKLRELSDTDWKNYIFFHLLQFYREVDNREIIELIGKEKQKERADIEETIKKYIRKWLKNNQQFDLHEFVVNREPSSEEGGFYDFKIEHSQWRNKYFALECKNLDESLLSINEYVYNRTKHDGGVYRFIIKKYARDLDFGGIIGFVIAGDSNIILEKIIQNMHEIFDNNDIGQLTDKCIIRDSIENNSNTFDSIHLRLKANKLKKHIFTLHHIIMAFTNS